MRISFKAFGAVALGVAFAVLVPVIPAHAADLRTTAGGPVTVEFTFASADFINTVSVLGPVSRTLFNTDQSRIGTQVPLGNFPSGTSFRFQLSATTRSGSFTWSSEPSQNSDGRDHMRVSELYNGDATLDNRVYQLAWEDEPDLGDADFNDAVAVLRIGADSDGDGLFDDWERFGIDTDDDGVVDLVLPAAAGVDPRRKDLFVEVDCLVSDGNGNGFNPTEAVDHSHCPAQPAITDVVQAFADAPAANADGTRGIQLHVDVGGMFGQAPGAVDTVVGSGGAAGHVGNLGGGGTEIPEAGNTVIDWDGATGSAGTSFYNLKAGSFDPARARIFRYAIFGHQNNYRQAVNDCTSGWAESAPGNDMMVTLGGWRDRNGNGTPDEPCWGSTPQNTLDDDGDGRIDEDPANGVDDDRDRRFDEDGGYSVGSRPEQGGTFMHELGHLLGLDHGGGDGLNNKPNYLSVMNYAFQWCSVPRSPAGATSPIPGGCDYSRIDVGLDETSLDECVGLGAALGFGPNNWDGDGFLEGVTNCQPPNNRNVPADVNGDGARTPLPGYEDWTHLSYSFQSHPSFVNGVADPVPDELDPERAEEARRRLSEATAPGVSVTVGGPATALPGQSITYSVETANRGRGPALQTELTAIKPDGAAVGFDLGDLLVGTTASRTVTHAVPLDACPSTLAVSARADFTDMAGVPGSAAGSTTTQVLDVTPPTIAVTLTPTSLWPPNHRLQTVDASVTANDGCDANPQVRLVSVTSSEPDNGLGDGDTSGDVAGASTGTDDRSFQLRAERAQRGPGRTYTVVYEARDASGNTSQATATVTVPPNASGR